MRFPIWILALLLAHPLLAVPSARIREVGLQGYYAAEPVVTRVLLEVENPSREVATVELRLAFRDALAPRARNGESWEYLATRKVEVPAQGRRALDLPVLLFPVRKPVLELEVKNAQGAVLGRDTRYLGEPLREFLVAIVCVDDSVCQGVQSRITFSGLPGEQTERGKLLKFVSVREAPAVWWAYAVAGTVVLARPMAGLSADQRAALEGYLRHGGRLVLVEDQVRDAEFLGAYRHAAAGRAQAVGIGQLQRVPRVAGPQMDAAFSYSLLRRLWSVFHGGLEASEQGWAHKRLASAFKFPSLAWLLFWLGVYTAVVGVVNFAFLRRLGRSEWAWVSVPVVALVFAAGLYAASVARRPTTCGVDEVAVYWMDEHSPLAAAEIGLRLSSPRQSKLTLTIPRDVVSRGQRNRIAFISPSGWSGAESDWDRQARRVSLGPPWSAQLDFLPWSFRDLQFVRLHRLPGTVRRLGRGELRNETGQDFREACYVDRENVYFVGALGPGASVDLASARKEPLAQHTGLIYWFSYGRGFRLLGMGEEDLERLRSSDPQEWERYMETAKQLRTQPFSLREMVLAWPRDSGHVFDTRSGVFFGLADEPVLGAELSGVPVARKNFVLTIVSFGRHE